MKSFSVNQSLSCIVFVFLSLTTTAKTADISALISKQQFAKYKDVADFIEQSPKVTIIVAAQPSDINNYGPDVVKSLTGSDCDRDGKMDDNPSCNAVYLKLWLKYKR